MDLSKGNPARTAKTATSAKPGPIAAFARFVVFGGGTGLAASGALVLLSDHLSIAVANAIVTVVSTLLATELHSRFSFRDGRSGWRVHAQSASTAAVAYVFTTTAVVVLHALCPSPSVLLEQAVYLSASGLAGIGRFVLLRTIVFATPKPTPAARVAPPRTSTAPTLVRTSVTVAA